MKDIDRFLEESFIPCHTIYKKVTDYYTGEITYEPIIPLKKIANLKKSQEEKQYITDYISKKGIKVIGFSDKLDFESDNYIYTRRYRGQNPKSISKEETMELLKQYYATRDENIRNKLVVGNMLLVNYALSNMNRDYYSEIYDLEQAGYIGLISAVEHYNPEEGSFSTFALSYIEGAIRKQQYELRGYKNSEYAFYTMTKDVENEYGEKVKNNPLLAEVIVDRLTKNGFRKTEHKDENIRRVLLNNCLDLDEILEQCGEESVYRLGYDVEDTAENEIYDKELEKIINEKLKTLKEMKQELLKMRFEFDEKSYTLMEIAELFGVSFQAIDSNIKRTLQDLYKDEDIQQLKRYLHREI